MKIADATIDAVRQLPADTVIGYYQTIKKQSGGRYTGLCKFHDDHNEGSFYVFERTNSYKCFACGEGGDPIKYVMQLKRMSFYEAIADIASNAGIAVEYEQRPNGTSPEEYKKQQQVRAKAEKALAYAQEYFTKHKAAAAEYLKGRDFSDETIDFFGIGYAPEGSFFTDLKKEVLKKVDLVREKEGRSYDTLRNRVTIPLHDRSGLLVGFSGRAIAPDAKAKYINPTDTLLYRKSYTLYNLNRAEKAIREKDAVYIVEGYPNVWRAHQEGVHNVVATCGTALTDEQIKLLLRYTKTIVLVYDGDEAGAKAFERSLNLLLAAGANVRMIPMPAGMDLDDVLRNPLAVEGWNTLLAQNEITWYDYYIRRWKANQANGEDVTANIEFINHLADLLLLVPDLTAANAYADKLSQEIKGLKTTYRARIKEKEEQQKKQAKNDAEENRRVISSDLGTWIMNSRGNMQKVSDFKISLLYQLVIPNTEDCDWVLEVKRQDQEPEIVVINNKDIISTIAIETAFYAKRYAIDIDPKQARYLRAYLLEQGLKVALRVDKLGYDQTSGFFFYSNVAYDPVNRKLLAPNALNIIDTPKQGYFMPYTDEEKAGKDKVIIRHEDSALAFDDIARFIVESWSRTESLALCFYVATVYMDIIIKRLRNFPILFLKGPGGSGKSELSKLLMDFAGRGVGDKLSVGANSSTAAMKELFAAYSNICVHLEDYSRASNIGELSDFLVLLFDRNFRKTMDMENRKSVKLMEPAASCVVSSNKPPLEDGSEALQSRLIYIQMKQNVRDPESKLKFIKRREDLKSKSWTTVNNYLLNHRAVVEKEFDKLYRHFVDMMSKHFKRKDMAVNDRVIASYATILAPISALESANLIPNFLGGYTLTEELFSIALENVEKQYTSLMEQSPLQIFWETVQQLVEEYRTAERQAATWKDKDGNERTNKVPYNVALIYPGSHYQIWSWHEVKGERLIDEEVLRFNINILHSKYEQRMKALGKVPATKNQLKDMLREHKSYVPDVSEHYIKYKKLPEEGGGDASLMSYILKYKDLQEDFGLDLGY